jgi:hypothetical protein
MMDHFNPILFTNAHFMKIIVDTFNVFIRTLLILDSFKLVPRELDNARGKQSYLIKIDPCGHPNLHMNTFVNAFKTV